MSASKAPTGLSVTRSGNTFTMKWKIGDKDYGNGQQLQYSVNKGAWVKPAIGATATSYAITSTVLCDHVHCIEEPYVPGKGQPQEIFEKRQKHKPRMVRMGYQDMDGNRPGEPRAGIRERSRQQRDVQMVVLT